MVAGTRPEAIKLASVVLALRNRSDRQVWVIDSGQHHGVAAETFLEFGIVADIVHKPPRGLSLARRGVELTHRLMMTLSQLQPGLLLYQGDTLTTFAAALAARRLAIRSAHVEAGLRSPNPIRPWPEEPIRRRVARIADWHFPPTLSAARHLLDEGTSRSSIAVFGNTGIDALRMALASMPLSPPDRSEEILVTLHRREAVGLELEQTCLGLLQLLERFPSLRLRLLLHPDPIRSAKLRDRFRDRARVTLASPSGYRDFVIAMRAAALIITDSGGIQEEAPYLGVPTLLVRHETERCEALDWPGILRVSPLATEILRAGSLLLMSPRHEPWAMDADAAFGDGHAGDRIVDWFDRLFSAESHCVENEMRATSAVIELAP